MGMPISVVEAADPRFGRRGGPPVTRRCRHLGADLANGSIDADGCLVCPWHQSKYDVRTGRMVRGPQGIFARCLG